MIWHTRLVRISAKVDYAIRAMTELAVSDVPVTAEKLAAAQDLPLRYLLGILGDLRRNRLVQSQRGPEGGFVLAQPADQISLADVFRAIDGPLAEVHDLSLTNLSVAGQAVLDPSVARAIAACPADVITLKLGINVINCDGLSRRTFVPAVHGFLDTIRQAQPLTPIVLMTAIACPIHENAPGPTVAGPDGKAMPLPRIHDDRDGRLTLAATREFIASVARSRNDGRLFLLDGLSLFGPADAHHLHDNLHPDLEGNDLIGERFVTIARDPESPLGRAFAAAAGRA